MAKDVAKSDLLGIPLSLQDMCMLQIVFRVRDFPVQSLALLPRKIRRKLLFGLSLADILHLDGTTLFDDVDSNSDHPHVSYARQCLLGIIMRQNTDTFPSGVSSHIYFFLSPHLKEVLQWFSREDCRFICHAESKLCKHIYKCCPSLESTMIRINVHDNYFFPKCFLGFIPQEYLDGLPNVVHCNPPVLPSPLLNYCNMHSAPTELKIDCLDFKSTTFWMDFEKAFWEKIIIVNVYSDHCRFKRRTALVDVFT